MALTIVLWVDMCGYPPSVWEDKFVGETEVLSFLTNDKNRAGTGVFPIVTKHS